MKGYLSVQQTADTWVVSVRWVNHYTEGKTPDCERFGRVWAIPRDAIKPDQLTPGVKSKRSSAVMNTVKMICSLYERQ